MAMIACTPSILRMLKLFKQMIISNFLAHSLQSFYIFLLIFFVVYGIVGQSYYTTGANALYKFEIGQTACDCDFEYIGPTPILNYSNGLTFTPDSILVGQGGGALYQIDTLTGTETQIFDPPPGTWNISSIAAIGNGIYYGILNWGQELYLINTITGTITFVGLTGFDCVGDLALFNGNLYFSTYGGIVLLDPSNPGNSEIVVTFPPTYLVGGLTASQICNSLLATAGYVNETPDLVLINLIDGAITPLCQMPNSTLYYISSMLEFATASDCDPYIDLDCNDSSGATDADYNASDYSCLSSGVEVADEDVRMTYDAYIATMEIRIAGSVPDAPDEILVSTGIVPGIDVSGSGTDLITLTNAGGARSTDFINALHLIRYQNQRIPVTPGLRTVEVKFTTESGAESNTAIAFIEVISLPLIEVELGADAVICEGESETFDAGHPGAMYIWSTGSLNQTITVGLPGEYSVTVSDGIQCPNKDTVTLEVLPLINVALIGDTEICDDEPANLMIQTNTPFTLTIDISSNPGSPFHFTDVSGDYPFTDLIGVTTTYTITNVTTAQEACIEITDPVQIIEVFPTYNLIEDVSICEGDSVWLGFYWETEAGMYGNTFNTVNGCDSMVTTFLSILPALQMAIQSYTCDPASAGVYITHLDNPNGCDTVVTTTVTLLPADTTLITLLSCRQTETGITIDSFVNASGCDSLVITTTTYVPPADTTTLFQTTCDSALVGMHEFIMPDQAGCDSLIITTISMGPADTTYHYGVSCDTASIGISQALFNNMLGCDSLVITTIIAGVPDTNYLYGTSCDSSSLGIFENHFTTAQQCDSLVITTITYASQDSTFLSSATCDQTAAGIFVTQWTNQFGCDSIVTTTVSLLPTSETFITSTTCDPASAGDFDHLLVNQYGCDSLVHETITLLPSDATLLNSTTCKVSEAGIFVSTLQNQYGCDSVITLTVTLVSGDTTVLLFNTCDPDEAGMVHRTYTNQEGCDSLVIETTSLYPLSTLNIISTSALNGYDISCTGASDGSIIADMIGTPPYAYTWSNGSHDETLTGIVAGDYAVTVVDGNGCEVVGSITLTEPSPLMITFVVSHPDCFDQGTGSIVIVSTGGVAPIQYSIDGFNYQTSAVFDGIASGMYVVSALDANDCSAEEIIILNAPLSVSIELGEDQYINAGDTTIIQAVVNVPFDSLASIHWSGLPDPACPTCLTQSVAPIITSTYTVSVTSVDGCMDADSLTLYLDQKEDVYVPNVFSPNGDGINDLLLVSTGSEIEEIEHLSIYDRWGNMVYLNHQFAPNSIQASWDGTFKSQAVDPGVFVYRILWKKKDGSMTSRYGDVTVIR